MPAPDFRPPAGAYQALNEAMRRMPSQQREPTELTDEVAALRREIAALREDLRPVPSLILTGREALDEFKRLAR